jgi:hypothetical protein
MQNQDNRRPTLKGQVSRREFLSGATVTLLMIPVAGVVSRCGTSSSPGSGCNGGGSTSTTVAGHFHTLCVPLADLNTPPAQGGTYSSSVVGGHSHTVTLTQAQLQAIGSGDGGSVTVTSSTSSAHTHDFTIVKVVSGAGSGGGVYGY